MPVYSTPRGQLPAWAGTTRARRLSPGTPAAALALGVRTAVPSQPPARCPAGAAAARASSPRPRPARGSPCLQAGACGLLANGEVACWGDDTAGQSTVPSGTGWRAVAARQSHLCPRCRRCARLLGRQHPRSGESPGWGRLDRGRRRGRLQLCRGRFRQPLLLGCRRRGPAWCARGPGLGRGHRGCGGAARLCAGRGRRPPVLGCRRLGARPGALALGLG